MKLYTKRLFLLSLVMAGLSGCAGLCDRREFATKAEAGATPVIKEYRVYVLKDTSLNDTEKKMRNRLADELESYLQEGRK